MDREARYARGEIELVQLGLSLAVVRVDVSDGFDDLLQLIKIFGSILCLELVSYLTGVEVTFRAAVRDLAGPGVRVEVNLPVRECGRLG